MGHDKTGSNKYHQQQIDSSQQVHQQFVQQNIKMVTQSQLIKLIQNHQQNIVHAKNHIQILEREGFLQEDQFLFVKKSQLTIIINLQMKIGNGSFGNLFIGFILFKNQSKIIKAAIKENILTEEQYRKQGYIISYTRQIEILQMIKFCGKQCENIVKYYAHFRYNEKEYIVFQYIQNLRIKDLIQSRVIKEAQIYDLMFQLVKAIYFLQIQVFMNNNKLSNHKKKQLLNTVQMVRDQRRHKQQFGNLPQNYTDNFGILHRDLKPDNILCYLKDGKYYLKLCDFGVSKLANVKGKHSYSVCGTKIYCPPQQEYYGYSGKLDVWGIGVILLQILNLNFAKFLIEKTFDLKNKPLEFFNHISKILESYDYFHWKYKRIWSKILNNCLKTNQDERWDIEKLKKFMEINKKRVDDNWPDGDQEEPDKNISFLESNVNQFQCIYLQTLKHQRSLKTKNPQYLKKIQYYAVLGIYFSSLKKKSINIKQQYKKGTNKFAMQNKYLEELEQMQKKIIIVMRPYAKWFKNQLVLSQMESINSKTSKFKRDLQQLHRYINTYLYGHNGSFANELDQPNNHISTQENAINV